MRPWSPRSLAVGLLVGLALALAAYGALRLLGFELRRHEAPKPTERRPLCYVSPHDDSYIRFQPGKDDKGHDLVPVYPVQPGAAPAGRTVKLWMSPADPTYITDKPGKDPQGRELVPFTGEMGGAGAAAPKKERKIKYWVSPMDPGYVRDQPGKAPCGMDLVPVYEDEAGQPQEGVIAVDPRTLQSMGVRTAKAEIKELGRTIRAVGKVAYDERRLTVVTTKISGWVERLYIKATGDPVRRGQNLVSLYSPELVATQEEYLLARRHLKALEQSAIPEYREGARRLVAAARQRLKNWDIPESQLAALERTGEVKRTLTLVSPVHGIVIKRQVTQGMMVQAGMPLLEVADLTTVWVEADVYEYELPWVKVGQHAHMTFTSLPGETFHGTVQYLYPYLKEATRTARLRLSVPNPGLKLKPEMYAQVEIVSPLKEPAVVVPAEAVLDTGDKQHVFVALGSGRFEPRPVKVGLRGRDGLIQVLSGLKGGEEVVTSAQFLLDSESRFREAIAQMLKAGERKGTPQEKAPAAAPAPAMPPGHKH